MEAPSAFAAVERLCSERSCSIGVLLKSLLPFDEDTPSSDQTLHLMPSRDNDHRHSQLRDTLVAMRKTIRIKMADEADYKQVQCPYMYNRMYGDDTHGCVYICVYASTAMFRRGKL